MSKYSRARNLVHARYTAKLANAVTRQLVEEKSAALLQGKGNKDILSLLGIMPINLQYSNLTIFIVKANASEEAKTRLTEEEIFAQMR
jgi:hypothetical protein